MRVKDYNIVNYALFVTFFPHLIAGPILHHSEMMPQFAQKERGEWTMNISLGLMIFAIGLFKKVVIADSAAPIASSLFADPGGITLLPAWAAALAYTVQIYFDFSGYSDMAIGIAKCFGINLPINFNSPYKAASVAEFWHRWHITLSRFLRDYLYIPLGGNRHGKGRRYANLFITMLLGGLWHGAGWTFIFWGTARLSWRLNAPWSPSRRDWALPTGRPRCRWPAPSPSWRWCSPGCRSGRKTWKPPCPCGGEWSG